MLTLRRIQGEFEARRLVSSQPYLIRTPASLSGLGMSPSAIGTALSIQGVWSVVCQLTFLSKLQRKYGSVRAFQRLNAGWVSQEYKWTVPRLCEADHAIVYAPGPGLLDPPTCSDSNSLFRGRARWREW